MLRRGGRQPQRVRWFWMYSRKFWGELRVGISVRELLRNINFEGNAVVPDACIQPQVLKLWQDMMTNNKFLRTKPRPTLPPVSNLPSLFDSLTLSFLPIMNCHCHALPFPLPFLHSLANTLKCFSHPFKILFVQINLRTKSNVEGLLEEGGEYKGFVLPNHRLLEPC